MVVHTNVNPNVWTSDTMLNFAGPPLFITAQQSAFRLLTLRFIFLGSKTKSYTKVCKYDLYLSNYRLIEYI